MNQNMLHLMESYPYLGDDGEKLNSSKHFLRHTSTLVKNFRDHRPIQSYTDPRLEKNCPIVVSVIGRQKNKSKKLLYSTDIEKFLISCQASEDTMSLLT